MELEGSIEVDGNSATYSVIGVGSNIVGFICRLDGDELDDCTFLFVSVCKLLTPDMHQCS